MKYLPLTIACIVVIVTVIAGDWAIRTYLMKKSQANYPAYMPPNPNDAQPAARPKVNEWQEYHMAREQAMRDNPDLAAEYQELRAEIEKQEQDVDAAMIKADPTVGPIIAKVALLRKHSLAPRAGTTNPTGESAVK